MEDNQNLLYIFIGDITNNTIIGEFPSKDSEHYKINLLFDKICNAKVSSTNQRNKITVSHGVLFYVISSKNIFYSVMTDSENENIAYKLINELEQEDITNFLNERGKLNFDGINILKNIYDKFELSNHNSDTLNSAQNEVNNVKLDVTSNIKSVLTNMDDIRTLDTKSSKIKDGALLFKDEAHDYRRLVWWQTMKFKIFVVSIVVIIVVWIILK